MKKTILALTIAAASTSAFAGSCENGGQYDTDKLYCNVAKDMGVDASSIGYRGPAGGAFGEYGDRATYVVTDSQSQRYEESEYVKKAFDMTKASGVALSETGKLSVYDVTLKEFDDGTETVDVQSTAVDLVTEKELQSALSSTVSQSDLDKLNDKIERVDDEDQRVVSGSVSDSTLTLVNRDEKQKASGADINKVDIDLSGLQTAQGSQNASDINSLKNTVDRHGDDIDDNAEKIAETRSLANSNKKDIIALQDKDDVLSNRIEEVADHNTTKNNAQDALISTKASQAALQAEHEKRVEQDLEIKADIAAKETQSKDRDDYLQAQVDTKASYEYVNSSIESANKYTQEMGEWAADVARDYYEANKNEIDANRAESIAEDQRIESESIERDNQLQAQIDTKVDQSEYEADQARQDAELSRVESDSIARDEALAAGVTAAQDTADLALGQAVHNYGEIVKLADESRTADAALDAKIDANKAEQAVTDAGQNKLITDNRVAIAATNDRITDVVGQQAKIDEAQDAARKAGDAATLKSANDYTDKSAKATLESANKYTDTAVSEYKVEQAKVDDLQNKVAQANKEATKANLTKIEDLYNLSGDNAAAIGQNKEAIAKLDGRVSKLEQTVEQQGSMIAGIGAQAAIPQADLLVGETALGMGAYTDALENDAVALQLQTMPTEKVRINVGLSAAPEDFSNTWQASVGGVMKF